MKLANKNMVGCGCITCQTTRIETKSMDFMNNYLTPPMTMVDIGAHVGHYAIEASPKVRQVYAFEADAEVFSMLKSNAAKYDNIIVGQHTIWNKTESLYFNVFSSGQHWASEEKAKPIVRNVTSTTLDELFIANDWPLRVDFMKIDIEGAELRCLRGARQILKHSPQMGLIVEVSPGHLKRIGDSIRDLLLFLSRWKFKEVEPKQIRVHNFQKKHTANGHYIRNINE